MTEVLNPFNQEPLSRKAAKLVLQIREARSRARKDARSGHPGRRAQGKRAISEANQTIRKIYLTEIQ